MMLPSLRSVHAKGPDLMYLFSQLRRRTARVTRLLNLPTALSMMRARRAIGRQLPQSMAIFVSFQLKLRST
jgi:hypothetical protein